jgi:predicted nucleotidyltransferase
MPRTRCDVSSNSIDPQDVEVLRFLDEVCARCSVEWFLVGAIARDVQLLHKAQVSPGRVTNDIDIAVLVDSWHEFQVLLEAILETNLFERTSSSHKVCGSKFGRFAGKEVDIVPFGGIESVGSMLYWPPDGMTEMSVAGFSEALAATEPVRFGEFTIRVASVPALAALKLTAWLSRRAETTKDAVDFERIVRTYEHVVGMGRIYSEEEADVLEAAGFHMETVSAQLLGGDVRRVISTSTFGAIVDLLESNDLRNRLIDHMEGGKFASGQRLRADEQLQHFEIGLRRSSPA